MCLNSSKQESIRLKGQSRQKQTYLAGILLWPRIDNKSHVQYLFKKSALKQTGIICLLYLLSSSYKELLTFKFHLFKKCELKQQPSIICLPDLLSSDYNESLSLNFTEFCYRYSTQPLSKFKFFYKCWGDVVNIFGRRR